MAKTETYPEAKIINGQTAVFVQSPFEDWSGGIYIPKEMTPLQFDKWWKTTRKNETDKDNDDRSPVLMYFEERFFLVLEWQIDGLTDAHLTGKAFDMPSMSLITLANTATVKLINQAQTLPLSPALSKTGTNGAKTANKTD